MIAELNKKNIIEYCEAHSNQDSGLAKELIEYTFIKLLCGKNIPCELEISNNSINNLHHLLIETKNIAVVGAGG